ncbi:hypothetical protein D9M72_555880 [compost metagenome]
MAHTEGAHLAGIEHTGQLAGGGHGQRRDRVGRVVQRDLRVGHDHATLQAEGTHQLVFERHALGRHTLDEELDQAALHGRGDQPLHLDARHTEALGDLLLRVAAHIGQPGGADGKAQFGVHGVYFVNI